MTPPAPDPVVGTVLKGTYRVDRRIAAGGMGVIYQASHVRLPKKYAIKVLTRDLARNEQVIARFRREAEIVAALGHPHIVDVVDFDALDSGEMYMVMEFLDGEDLADRLRRGPLSLASTVRVFMDVCDALDRAHAEGIVHRDLKPANIFLISQSGRDDYAKVLDFGISKILEAAGTQMTLEQSIMGTPSYMAPEQAAGAIHEIDHRTDVFALGAILYECLTGQMAFPGTTPFAVIQKITGEPPPRLAAAAPHLPAALDEVVQRAMARAKADRFASAGALCQALIAAAGVPSAELGRVVTGTDHARTAPTRTSAPAGAVVESTLSAAASEREGEQAIATVGARERRGRAGLW
ncbi:MAG: serine/threonine protein kinase, partial [Deltaproteobacteria bacterium]